MHDKLSKASKRESSRRSALFRDFDKDADGRLSQTEATALAKKLLAEAQKVKETKVNEEALQRFLRGAVEEDGKVESFALLASCVGAFREMERDGRRRLTREARQKLLASLQSKWRRRVQDLEGSTGSDLEATLKEVESAVAPLLTETSSPPEQMQTRAEECEAMIQKAQQKAEDFQKKVQQLPVAFLKEVNSKQVQTSELDEIMAQHQKRLALRAGRTGQRLERAKRLTELFRAKANRKENDSIEKALGQLQEALRAYAKSQDWSPEQLFRSGSEDSETDMTESAFLDLCAKATSPCSQELASKVFQRALPEDVEDLPLSAFQRLLKVFYKVTQETPMTEDRPCFHVRCFGSAVE